jgi:hypothetical protein
VSPTENCWGPADVVEKIALGLAYRAKSHRITANGCARHSEHADQRRYEELARECERIALHLTEGRNSL